MGNLDRTFRGFIAGFFGALAMDAWSLLSFYLVNLTEQRYFDWGAMIVLGDLPQNLLEIIIGLTFQLVFSGAMGVVFAFILVPMTSYGIVWKGALFGFLLTFLLYAMAAWVGLDQFTSNNAGTVISESIGGLLWGVVTAAVLNKITVTEQD